MFKIEIWNDDHDFYLTDQAWKYCQWARANCKSFVEYEFVDMSDIDSWAGDYDSGWFYYFNDEEDAIMFSLKFQGNQQLI